MLANLLGRVPSQELRVVLGERVGQTGQYGGASDDPNNFYLPLWGDSCQVVLTYDGAEIIGVERGPALSVEEWERLNEELENSLVRGPQTLGRDFSFNGHRVLGWWRGAQSGVQILPPPANTPVAPVEIADHPFILEFPIQGSDVLSLTNYRRIRDHRRLTLLLNVLLQGGTSLQPLRTDHFWERWLVPAFVFFFKLVYPFARGNNPKSRLGVAAGGCILLRTEMLATIGGFEAVRGAVIDDCTLAQKVKEAGGKTWIGLSRGVKSHRPYPDLSSFWAMISRTAYTQLRYSVLRLLAVTCLMLIVFWGPFLAIMTTSWMLKVVALVGWSCMIAAYLPTVRFYRLSPLWTATLPIIATLYLLMTWSSAIEYWKGRRSIWKGRVYRR